MKKILMLAALLLAGPAFAGDMPMDKAGGFRSLSSGGGSWEGLSTAPDPIPGSVMTYTWPGGTYSAPPAIVTYSWKTLMNNIKTSFGGGLKVGCSSTYCSHTSTTNKIVTGYDKVMMSQKYDLEHGWARKDSSIQRRPN